MAGYLWVRSASPPPIVAPGLTEAAQITATNRAAGDALVRRTIAEVDLFTDWLAGAQGYVGEFGVPVNDPDPTSQALYLNQLDAFLYALDAAGIHGTGWASGAWMGGADFDNHQRGVTAYWHNNVAGGRINTKSAAADLITAHTNPGGPARGTNVSGMDWNGGRNSQIGGFIVNDSECAVMGAGGMQWARVVSHIESLYPELDGPLSATGMARVGGVVKRLWAQGIRTILDCNHSDGRYVTAGGSTIVIKYNEGTFQGRHLVDFWQKVSAWIKSDPDLDAAVKVLDLINEPYGWPAQSDGLGFATALEMVTQDIVTALRAAGENRTIAVPTYGFSQMAQVKRYHPGGPWITDPANNFWYETHQYWDQVRNGIYRVNGTLEPYSVGLAIAAG